MTAKTLQNLATQSEKKILYPAQNHIHVKTISCRYNRYSNCEHRELFCIDIVSGQFNILQLTITVF